MNENIVNLVKDALTHMGCPLSVVKKIEPNSPINFSFNNGVVMHLMSLNDAIWLWSPIADYSETLIERKGAHFLAQIMRRYPFFVTERMLLSNEDGKLMLQAMVNEETLRSVPYFAVTLQVFFDAAQTLRQIIKD